MTSTVRLRDWASRNRVSASHLQEPVDAIRELILASAQGDGDRPRIIEEKWTGKVVEFGPNGETLASVKAKGEQYWVQRQVIAGGQPNDPIKTANDESNDGPYDTQSSNSDDDDDDDATPPGNIYLVTNLADLPHHCRSVALGSYVSVWAEFDSGLTAITESGSSGNSGAIITQPDNQKHYLMNEPCDPRFQLVANATPNGTYTAHPFYASSAKLDQTSSSSNTQSNLGTVDTTVTVYLANDAEQGLSGHALLFTAPTYLPQIFKATYWKQAIDGKPVFVFFGMQWKAC